ncbi:MAG: GNAT family N-acetyltransferase [bacterium]|nr:GNAT family N-acetyltransferase [bacterium]
MSIYQNYGYNNIMTNIRNASEKDIGQLVGLMKSMIDYHHELDAYYKPADKYVGLEDEVAAWLKNQDINILIAEDDGVLTGYLRVGVEEGPLYTEAKKIGVVHDIFVQSGHRQKGIAKELFQESLKWFAVKKVKNIELDVSIKNDNAIQLWDGLGFKDYKRRMRLDI